MSSAGVMAQNYTRTTTIIIVPRRDRGAPSWVAVRLDRHVIVQDHGDARLTLAVAANLLRGEARMR